MKNSIVRSAAVVIAMIMLSVNVFGGSFGDDNDKSKKVNAEANKNISPNGNYKHIIPTSKGNKFRDSFTKPGKDKTNRNYKQQNQEKRSVKFKDNFTGNQKTNHSSYKHPQGL